MKDNNIEKKPAGNRRTFYCQAISLLNASSPVHAWDLRHYFWEMNSSKEFLGTSFLERVWETFQFKIRRLFGLAEYPLAGDRKVTPVEKLNLSPGEIVEVKSLQEILETLDSEGRNRGLQFMPEMLKYCGGRYRVFKRVERMIFEATGEMIPLKDTVILENVYCDGKAHNGCQRNCFFLWKEIWLKRIGGN